MKPGRRLFARIVMHDVTPLLAGLDDLQQRVARALGPDVLGEDVVATGDGTAGVAVVALDRREQQRLVRRPVRRPARRR